MLSLRWLESLQDQERSVLLLFSPSVVSSSTTAWTAARQTLLPFTVSQSLLKLMSSELVIPSNHLILHHRLLLFFLIIPHITVYSNELPLLVRWPKYWRFSFSISPSNEYPGLIAFRIDWFDLLGSKDSQEASPTAQYESISSSVFCLLYGSTLVSIQDYWKSHRSIWTLVGNVSVF